MPSTPADERAAIIADFHRSGLSMHRYSRDRKLGKRLYAWLKRPTDPVQRFVTVQAPCHRGGPDVRSRASPRGYRGAGMIPANVVVHVAVEPVSLIKSIDGLAGVAMLRAQLAARIVSNDALAKALAELQDGLRKASRPIDTDDWQGWLFTKPHPHGRRTLDNEPDDIVRLPIPDACE